MEQLLQAVRTDVFSLEYGNIFGRSLMPRIFIIIYLVSVSRRGRKIGGLMRSDGLNIRLLDVCLSLGILCILKNYEDSGR